MHMLCILKPYTRANKGKQIHQYYVVFIQPNIITQNDNTKLNKSVKMSQKKLKKSSSFFSLFLSALTVDGLLSKSEALLTVMVDVL